MRSIRLVHLFLLLSSALLGRAQFGSPIVLPVQPAPMGPSLEVHDVNGDGIADLVLPHATESLVWHQGSDGQGAFLGPQPMLPPGDPLWFWTMADLTGDGRPDLVAKTPDGQQLFWSENNGTGTFGPPQVLWDLAASGLVSITALVLEELTGDGLRDIVVTGSEDGYGARLFLAVNEAGEFSDFEPIGPEIAGAPSAFLLAGNLDLVGGIDLVLKDGSSNLIVLRNTAGDATEWTTETLLSSFSGLSISRPGLIDVDGDGDLDLAEAGFPDVYWLENQVQEGGVLPPLTPHQLSAWDTAGPGAFGELGCGAGAGYVVSPLNPAEAPRFAHWLEALGAFSYPNAAPALAQVGTVALMADISGDGRDDLLSLVGGEWVLFLNELQPAVEEVVCPALPALCKWGPEVPLPEAQPAGGRWSGPGVVDDQLLRMMLPGSGDFSLGYTVYGAGGCAAAATASVTVVEQPLLSPFIGGSYCRNEPPIQVTSVPPATAWVGLGPDGLFNPATFTGSTVVAVYVDPTGVECDAESAPIFMLTPVNVHINPLGPLCVNSGPQLITISEQLDDLYWSGDVVSWNSSGATFLPAQGAGTYQVVVVANPPTPSYCEGSDTLVLVVNDQFPVVDIEELPYFCAESPAIELSPYAQPPGGVWAGPGVSGGLFNPQSVSAGAYLLSYTATLEGCIASEVTAVKVLDAAAVTPPENSDALCGSDAPVEFIAFPPGGTWGAPLTADGIFDPASAAPGTYAVSYTWTGPDGCVLQATAEDLVVLPNTLVVIEPVGVICQNGPPVTVMGSPGGIWSGAVEGEGGGIVFDPGALATGSYTLTLSATAPGQCPGSATVELVVEVCTGMADGTTTEARAWPNPFEDQLTLHVGGADLHAVEWLDPAGRVLHAMGPQRPGTQLVLALPDAPAGAYLLRLVPAEGAPQVLRVTKL